MNKRDFLKAAGAASLAALLDTPGLAARAPEDLARDEAFWAEIRSHFPTDNRFINLENGFYCFQPSDVFDAFVANARAVNGEASHYMRTRLDTDVVKIRTAVAALAAVPVEELVVTRNTTESLDTVINGIPWQAGDEAVMATQDYGSMMDMFALQARRHGIVNRIVRLPLDPASDAEIVETYRKAITPRTKLLMVSHIVGGTGQVLPVAAICDMAHGLGVPVMVDGAHSFAHLDFKIADLRCDYFGASLHKWLSAPLGLGVLWVRRDRIAGLWPMFGDASMADDDIRKLNHRGTHPVHSDLTLPRAIAFHEAIGAERKMARLRFLQQSWTSRARAIRGVYLNTPRDPARTCAIANVGLNGLAPAMLAETLLKDHNIYTVAIDRGEVKGVRVTPQIYTSPAELDALVAALTKIAGRAA
ncbi:aminotransferase class V-fold PLP-dependent enzyme [Sphingomonas sp. H39-1-10]|uniref:aminotransferase class V-fold PLP-dependent enzyme n=1 Tax=Sphingomonas TaxID=13687 RepID=UPI000881054A|nr:MULTISPECIES: aminotransferase class V-fold PLP-dependent enzyme [Sphingomonas]MDF0487307.1 aminotransferase class V-fold PLP-dependent enzyme [Sphingomonas pollutisoli]SDA15373.1 Selenocysteine lyase/Cysteine desulfurase [Sphingomonas sp. NFR15]